MILAMVLGGLLLAHPGEAAATPAPVLPMAPSAILSALLAFAIGDLLQPPFVQRILAADSAATVHRGYLATVVFLAGWFVAMGAVGIFGRARIPDATAPDMILPAMVVPVLAAILTRQRNHLPALFAQVTGFGVSLSWTLLSAPEAIPPIVAGLAASAGAFVFVQAATRRFQPPLPFQARQRGQR